MKPAVLRLVLCAGLFVLWLGYLGYLVLTRPVTTDGRPLVLSRPQIQASEIDIVAELPRPEDRGNQEDVKVKVVKVLHSNDAKPEAEIRVTNLEACHPLPATKDSVPPADWTGAGEYLLPLRRLPGEPVRYEVMPIPASPGFTVANVFRIYPATAEALAQYGKIGKARRNGE